MTRCPISGRSRWASPATIVGWLFNICATNSWNKANPWRQGQAAIENCRTPLPTDYLDGKDFVHKFLVACIFVRRRCSRQDKIRTETLELCRSIVLLESMVDLRKSNLVCNSCHRQCIPEGNVHIGDHYQYLYIPLRENKEADCCCKNIDYGTQLEALIVQSEN